MPVYNKLVRDKIPRIIAQGGKKYRIEILPDDEFRKELLKKGREEWEEYMRTNNDSEAVEELADLLEIIYALAEVHGSTIEELEDLRQQKAQQRGGFQERIFLIDVQDP